jgi:hypothetical protein
LDLEHHDLPRLQRSHPLMPMIDRGDECSVVELEA